MTDLAATARQLLATNRYAVLGTVDGDEPWVNPVWFAHRGIDTLAWVSRPDSRHSRAIAAVPRVAVTVFDSTVVPGHGTAFYGRGAAGECPEDELPEMLALYTAESERQGIGAWGAERVSGESEFRLYVARLEEVSLLLDDGGPDIRVPVDLSPA